MSIEHDANPNVKGGLQADETYEEENVPVIHK
jgi:hypothetical protein